MTTGSDHLKANTCNYERRAAVNDDGNRGEREKLVEQEKWNEIVEEAEARIAKWNARAKERGLQDTFLASVRDVNGYSLLITQHKHDPDRSCAADDVKAVAREVATGQLRPTKIKKHKGTIVGFAVKPPPKAWKSLADKPAESIVGKLRLVDFVVLVGAYPDNAASTAT